MPPKKTHQIIMVNGCSRHHHHPLAGQHPSQVSWCAFAKAVKASWYKTSRTWAECLVDKILRCNVTRCFLWPLQSKWTNIKMHATTESGTTSNMHPNGFVKKKVYIYIGRPTSHNFVENSAGIRIIPETWAVITTLVTSHGSSWLVKVHPDSFISFMNLSQKNILQGFVFHPLLNQPEKNNGTPGAPWSHPNHSLVGFCLSRFQEI